MLVKRPCCNEFATPPRTLVFTTRIIKTWWEFKDWRWILFLIFSASLNLPQWYSSYSSYYIYPLLCLTLPIQRGIHDINRPFAFRSNPRFIFHDSPGVEGGDEEQLQEILSFIEKKAKSTEVDDQLHAIWSVLLSHCTFRLLTSFLPRWKVLYCSE